MSSNIEIKARANNFKWQQGLAEEISDIPAEVIEQEDTFFNIPNGRLKLRKFDDTNAELIYYLREDSVGPKLCSYTVTPTNEPENVKKIMASKLGIRGVVKKRRTLYKAGNTRIHFDLVEGLGEFVELEYVMSEDSSEDEALKAISELMEKLEINESELIDCAYIDLKEA